MPPSVRVSDDSVRYMAHPKDFTAFTLEASKIACMELALSYCDSGFLPILDGVFEDVEFLAGQALGFERRGYQLITISLTADLDDLLHRNALRDPLQRMDVDRIHHLYSTFQSVGISLGIRGKLPELVCDDILAIIEAERSDQPLARLGDDEVDLLFLRAGTPDYPLQAYADPFEVPLSPQGRAEALAARHAVRRFTPDVVLSSDFAWASETTQLACAGLDVTVESVKVLRELAPDQTNEAARTRTLSFFDQLPARYGGKPVFVVGHVEPHLWLVERALGVELKEVGRLRWNTGCFSRFTLSPEQTRLEAMNVTPNAVA